MSRPTSVRPRELLDGDPCVGYVHQGEYFDETIGVDLDGMDVEKARCGQIAFLRQMYFYEKVPFTQAMETTGRKPIGTKWVNVLKTSGKHRSRRVVKEVIDGDDPAMHPPTPPRDGINAEGRGHAADALVCGHGVVQVARRQGHPRMATPAHPECVQAGEPKQRGKLAKSMYRPRHMAVAWQSEVHTAMDDAVMEPGAFGAGACGHCRR